MAEMLTAAEAAATLKISTAWLRRLVKEGKLPAYRGKQRRYLFDRRDVTIFQRTYPSNHNPIPTKGNE